MNKGVASSKEPSGLRSLSLWQTKSSPRRVWRDAHEGGHMADGIIIGAAIICATALALLLNVRR